MAAAAVPAASVPPITRGSAINGAVPQGAGFGMSSGDAGFGLPFPQYPVGGATGKRGGELSAISNQANAPLFTMIEHYPIAGITERFQPHELLFVRTGAFKTGFMEHTPVSAAMTSIKQHYITLSALNHILEKNRDVEGYTNPEWVRNTFVPVGVAAAVQGNGWSERTMSNAAAGSASIVTGGEYHILDYTAALDTQIVQPGMYLGCELRMVEASRNAEFTAEALSANGAGEKGALDRIARADTGEAKAAKAAMEKQNLPDVPDGNYTFPAERPDARFQKDAMRQKSLFEQNNKELKSKHYLQYVVTTCQSPALETPTDVAASILWGAPPPYRFIIGKIANTSKQLHTTKQKEILFPGVNAVKGPNFGMTGLLTVKIGITNFNTGT